VPADAGADHRRAGLLHRPGEDPYLVLALSALHEVEHREPVDEEERGSDPLAHGPYDLDRHPHPALVGAAPLVGALVGTGCEELVEQVPSDAMISTPS